MNNEEPNIHKFCITAKECVPKEQNEACIISSILKEQKIPSMEALELENRFLSYLSLLNEKRIVSRAQERDTISILINLYESKGSEDIQFLIGENFLQTLGSYFGKRYYGDIQEKVF